MFMFLLKPILKMRARNVEFRENSLELSEETTASYVELKLLYARLVKSFMSCKDDTDSAPLIIRDFLSFYLKGETLALALFNEIFKPNFYESIDKRKSIFVLLNKIMKIFISLDCIRLKHPEVFCQFSTYKLEHRKRFSKQFTELENQRLSILGLITLPMGRLVMSLFATEKCELFYPAVLSKRIRINLNNERKRYLYLYSRLAELNNLNYLCLFLVAIYRRFFGSSSFNIGGPMKAHYDEYLRMLQEHE